MARESVLVWSGRADKLYREARRQITSRNKSAPRTVKELNFSDFFNDNQNALAYFPVFQGTTGWWGEMLGTNAKILSKMIISPECQLYEIGTGEEVAARKLYAAEVMPRMFRKLRETATMVKDMIATDSGTIMALFVANSESKVKNCVRACGGEYLGSLGGY
ncbi:MAG: hypothetical protein LBT45_02970 [Rickettsiales bacterium]|jgi:hypothetical protein|nr:hypothetical protein [Rickettsiales bacterium]